MSNGGSKSVLASVVGWLIVALLVYWFLGIIVGTIAFVVRFIVWIVLLGLLLAAYFKLKEPSD
jgi:hypothetical protein